MFLWKMTRDTESKFHDVFVSMTHDHYDKALRFIKNMNEGELSAPIPGCYNDNILQSIAYHGSVKYSDDRIIEEIAKQVPWLFQELSPRMLKLTGAKLRPIPLAVDNFNFSTLASLIRYCPYYPERIEDFLFVFTLKKHSKGVFTSSTINIDMNDYDALVNEIKLKIAKDGTPEEMEIFRLFELNGYQSHPAIKIPIKKMDSESEGKETEPSIPAGETIHAMSNDTDLTICGLHKRRPIGVK